MMYGVMLDCSRNGVMTVKALKKYVQLLAQMGYNTLMLYTEDTYEVDGEPHFGHLRGRYSKAELKTIDAYCREHGIELIPCVQTLAHLNCMFKWDQYQEVCDCDDILLIGEEETYQLIDKMFSTIEQCFTSRKIHIGMDEAYKVGLGKYLERNGYENRFDIINQHLHRVCEIAENHGFEPMIWSDMFCKLALDSNDYYAGDLQDIDKIREQSKMPENISLVYWDYYSTDYNRYMKMMKLNRAFGKKVYFAGGAWTWKGFAPDNTFSIAATESAMKACLDSSIDGWFMTVWGDDGDECSKFAILPALLYAIEAAKGNTNMEEIKRKFYEITGASFDAFLLMDHLDEIGGGDSANPSKYMFYNDLFLGLNDYRCSDKDNHHYKELAEKLKLVEGKGEYAPLFDLYEDLCRVLMIKADLGLRTRKYYQSGDKVALEELANYDYAETINRVKQFYRSFKKVWMSEKKPHGFDIQDIRIGGVIQRLESCRERLLEYVGGQLEEIPELEECILPKQACGKHWSRLVSPNVISHSL